jgi:predicted pyridoxine 5'-phosphate oxidase superfamily flavin-nucleotide-binding protein
MDDHEFEAGPFHEGEIAVQARTGERGQAQRHAAVISRDIVAGARPFLARQRLLAVTAAGDDGQLWTSVWLGRPGFVQSSDGRRVDIDRARLSVSQDDPALARTAAGRAVGLLALEFESRRRLRINGTVEKVSPASIEIAVRESVPNCPKYIQRRRAVDVTPPSSVAARAERGRAIDADRRHAIERADTAFVGSLHAARGVDASHRGGEPGFIRVVDERTLRLPDYAGNSMFMTLGNYASDPRASLTVVDFEAGRALALSGAARIEFDADHPDHPTGGTRRYWEFAIREWLQFDLPRVVRWERLDASPFNPPAHAT